MNFTRTLIAYLTRNPIGEILSTDNLFVLGPATKRSPDLSIMSAERMRKIEPGKDIDGAPDLAIEVLSPSDSMTAVRRKVKQYFAAGARLVWIVDPEGREIEVWTAGSGAVILNSDQLLTGGEVLPDVSARVDDLL
jgi:Uma2 family endonuclease